jgi:hypothetical protein
MHFAGIRLKLGGVILKQVYKFYEAILSVLSAPRYFCCFNMRSTRFFDGGICQTRSRGGQ